MRRPVRRATRQPNREQRARPALPRPHRRRASLTAAPRAKLPHANRKVLLMTAVAPPDRLTLERYATPIGDLLLASDDDGRLRGVDLYGDEARMTKWLHHQYGPRL